MTAGALIRDSEHRVLLVEPTYRRDWLTPGGSVEARESPARAAAREVLEELGVPLPIGRLLVMQWRYEPGDPDGVVNFVYDGGIVDDSTIERFRIEAGLASFRFVDAAVIADVADIETTDRLTAALDALASNTIVELGND